MTDVAVRRAGPGDEQALADLAVRTFPLACPPHTAPEDIERYQQSELSVEQFAADLRRTGVVFHVAEIGPEVVGYTMLIGPTPPPDGPAGRNPVELRRIYVDEARHKNGVGHALMATALRHARTHGYDQVWLGTNQLNERAIAFYERQGFAITGAKTFRVGSATEHDHVMTRPV